MNTLPPEPPKVSKEQRNRAHQEMFLTERRKNVGYVSATEVLTNPAIKLTARGRRKLGKKRVVRYVSTVEPKSVHEAIAAKVKASNITGLIRMMNKSKRRISEGQRVLAELSPDSMFRANVEREINLETLINRAADAEYTHRTNTAKNWPKKDARNPQHKRIEALRATFGGTSL